MKALFVCNQNRHRSRTAEEIFSKEMETRSAGLYGGQVIMQEDIAWADIVFVMEDFQRSELARRFPDEYMQKRIVSLGVPDIYQYKQPELVKLLRERVKSLSLAIP